MHNPKQTRSYVHIIIITLGLVSVTALSANIQAQSTTSTTAHGPGNTGFSHNFQRRAHEYKPQLNVHFGLSQPVLFGGFNIAADLRIGRWVMEYSHGMWLDYNRVDSVARQFVGDTGAGISSPWTTGAGLGYILLDDLYVMIEAKVHHYDLSYRGASVSYTTASLGPALAYRLFLWRGLNITAYARYWPNVWSSASKDQLTLENERFDPVNLGFFANLSLGWSFDL